MVTPTTYFANEKWYSEQELLMHDIDDIMQTIAAATAKYEMMKTTLKRRPKRPKHPGGHWWKLLAALIIYKLQAYLRSVVAKPPHTAHANVNHAIMTAS